MTNSDLAALVRNALAAKTVAKKAPAPARQDDASADAAAALRAIGWSEKQIREALASAAPKQQEGLTVTVDIYKGNPVISLRRGKAMPFSFGLAKARMIVEAYEKIKRFADANAEAKRFAESQD